jgi:IS4 transposase
LASLYRARWNNELDLRSIKVTLQMDVLRCKVPDLVRKEIWTHVLAYNLIRTVMAQAAAARTRGRRARGNGARPLSLAHGLRKAR